MIILLFQLLPFNYFEIFKIKELSFLALFYIFRLILLRLGPEELIFSHFVTLKFIFQPLFMSFLRISTLISMISTLLFLLSISSSCHLSASFLLFRPFLFFLFSILSLTKNVEEWVVSPWVQVLKTCLFLTCD